MPRSLIGKRAASAGAVGLALLAGCGSGKDDAEPAGGSGRGGSTAAEAGAGAGTPPVGSGGAAGAPDNGSPVSGDLAELVDNEWVELPLSVVPLAGALGSYQQRGWCTLRFMPGRDTLAFYEGFQHVDRGDYCIYANALYEIAPASGEVQQRSLSNWYCDDSGGYHELEGLPDSPVDRHTYAQFAYAPSSERLYMIAGAAARFDLADRPYDFWSYSPELLTWERMPESYPGAEQDRAVELGPYTGNLIHHPPSNTLYYFMAADRIHLYAIDTGEWTTIADATGSTDVTDVGAHGLYDPERDRFAFYGNNWHPEDAGTNEFVFFDVVSASWEHAPVAPPPAGPPPKSYAPLEYDSEHDVYLLHSGWNQSDTWIYDPRSESWRELATATAPPPAGTGTYVAYAAPYGALFRLDEAGPRLYGLRYRPEP